MAAEDYNLTYSIKDFFSGAQNNTIKCEIIRNHSIIKDGKGEADLRFGTGNTQGTGYKFNL